ncbi:hypothetical protein PoB_003994300 [Plakobranchus ocellatus]|uniref:Uncharacterized protein n=1 Tax=Plakobranchus ocellatus TaxID=259542 RepID=A0AAV4B3V0_9GAST|nr:hypothetical protein PoB_003994300 [Plakobranchus ocellatus]
MNAAGQIFLILGILSFLLMKTLGKNPYKSMKPRYCSRVNHTPDQHLQVLATSLGDRDTSLQAGRGAANMGRESMSKRADDNESLDCSNRHSLVQGIVRESGKYVLGETLPSDD